MVVGVLRETPERMISASPSIFFYVLLLFFSHRVPAQPTENAQGFKEKLEKKPRKFNLFLSRISVKSL
jgi:hypothetical protein